MATLRDFFQEPDDLLRLEPEELAGILIEVIPDAAGPSGFLIQGLADQLFSQSGGSGFPRTAYEGVTLVLAEAVAWMTSQGLVIQNPDDSGSARWLVLTRRGRQQRTRVDVEAYRKAGVLPMQLLQPHLAEKVHHLFVRGDHDVAVGQAFKEVEVAVREACGWGNDALGVPMMRRAFHPETGPLTDMNKVMAEREADVSLFAGAIGHAKNPASHRNVTMSREEAARLIVFASHLLAIVEERAGETP